MKDAEANADADAKRKAEVDLKNEVDQAIFSTEKTLEETEGKGFDAERDAAQAALDDLKKAQESGDTDDMREKLGTLNEKAQALAVKLYQQATASQGEEGADQANDANPKESGDDVVDGEFTEKWEWDRNQYFVKLISLSHLRTVDFGFLQGSPRPLDLSLPSKG